MAYEYFVTGRAALMAIIITPAGSIFVSDALAKRICVPNGPLCYLLEYDEDQGKVRVTLKGELDYTEQEHAYVKKARRQKDGYSVPAKDLLLYAGIELQKYEISKLEFYPERASLAFILPGHERINLADSGETDDESAEGGSEDEAKPATMDEIF